MLLIDDLFLNLLDLLDCLFRICLWRFNILLIFVHAFNEVRTCLNVILFKVFILDWIKIDFITDFVKDIFESSWIDFKSKFLFVVTLLKSIKFLCSKDKIFLHLSYTLLDELLMSCRFSDRHWHHHCIVRVHSDVI